jgi:uracil-DNA glycosylase
MDTFETIDISEFEKLNVQLLAVSFNCKVSDINSIVDIEIRKPGSIELYKKLGKRFVLMYVSALDKKEYKQCFEKISHIKNLKSIAFPEVLITIPILLPLLTHFAEENPDIKVYILRGSLQKNVKEVSICPHLSFGGNLASQINTWRENKSGWAPFFESIVADKTLSILNDFLRKEAKEFTIYPEPNKIFNAMILTKLVDIKVIIIGQDPYHTPGAAMGLAFSHEKDCKKIQPSLKNIYAELKSCGYKVNEKSGDLTKWAEQGVFLINTALTVRQGKPNSHSKEWESFTKKLFAFLNKNIKRSVVVMWGGHAQSYENLFDASRHKLIKSVHPSPLSAHSGFFGSKPFTLCNKQLKTWGIKEVDWNLNIEMTYKIVEDTKTGKNMYQTIEGTALISERLYCCYRDGNCSMLDCDCGCDACDH